MDLRREDLAHAKEPKHVSSKVPQLNTDKENKIFICHNRDGSREYHTEWSN